MDSRSPLVVMSRQGVFLQGIPRWSHHSGMWTNQHFCRPNSTHSITEILYIFGIHQKLQIVEEITRRLPWTFGNTVTMSGELFIGNIFQARGTSWHLFPIKLITHEIFTKVFICYTKGFIGWNNSFWLLGFNLEGCCVSAKLVSVSETG